MFRVERLVAIPHLEMEVRPAAAARIAAEADNRTGRHIIVLRHVATCQVGIPGFQPVFVADDDQIAVTAGIVPGIAHFAVESGVYRFADGEGDIHSLMPPPAAGTVFREDFAYSRGVEIPVLVNELQVDNRRQLFELDVRIGENPVVHPMFPIDLPVHSFVQVGIVVTPGIVREYHYFDIAVVRIERIYRPARQVFEFRDTALCGEQKGDGPQYDGTDYRFGGGSVAFHSVRYSFSMYLAAASSSL